MTSEEDKQPSLERLARLVLDARLRTRRAAHMVEVILTALTADASKEEAAEEGWRLAA